VNAISCTRCTSLGRDCRQPAGRPDAANCANCAKVHSRCTRQEYQPAGLYAAALQASTAAHTAQALAISASQASGRAEFLSIGQSQAVRALRRSSVLMHEMLNLLLGETYGNDPDHIPPEIMLRMDESRRLLSDDSLLRQIDNLLPVTSEPEAGPSGAASGGARGAEVDGSSAAPVASDAPGGSSVDPVVRTAFGLTRRRGLRLGGETDSLGVRLFLAFECVSLTRPHV
ncbi:hypothetical protein PHLCEN_2v6302, partial [Hermanssonia centrifuga]